MIPFHGFEWVETFGILDVLLVNVILNAAIDWWHRIEIGDPHFCWGFLAREGWLLELLNASVEVVLGGLLGKDFGGSSSENRKSSASPVHDWT
jgi:hypothetical protein